jgi:hypothetical protein
MTQYRVLKCESQPVAWQSQGGRLLRHRTRHSLNDMSNVSGSHVNSSSLGNWLVVG